MASLEAAISLNKASPEERQTLLSQLTGFTLKLNQHDATIKWASAYLQAGGGDEQVRAALVRAALAKGDCAVAAPQLAILIDAAEVRRVKPPEGQLRAAVACRAKLGDDEGYYRGLERLIGHHPRKEYWADVIARLQRRPGFSDRLLLDTFRLMRHVGAMDDADDFMSAAQLAMQAALPGEAKAILQAGFESGVLGKGSQAQKHRELQARATREAEADRAQLDDAERQAAQAADGRLLFLVGQAAGTYGQTERSVRLMEQALTKGISRHSHDARLQLALALASIGRLNAAQSQLADLPAQDGLGDLARLWLIALR